MIFNFLLGIWCHNCNRYLDPYIEIYINVLYENSITCSKNHLVGHVIDPQWQEYFYGDEQ